MVSADSVCIGFRIGTNPGEWQWFRCSAVAYGLNARPLAAVFFLRAGDASTGSQKNPRCRARRDWGKCKLPARIMAGSACSRRPRPSANRLFRPVAAREVHYASACADSVGPPRRPTGRGSLGSLPSSLPERVTRPATPTALRGGCLPTSLCGAHSGLGRGAGKFRHAP
jgi:hypothetical protein